MELLIRHTLLAMGAILLTFILILPGWMHCEGGYEWRALLFQNYDHPSALPYREVPRALAAVDLGVVLIGGAVLPALLRRGKRESHPRVRRCGLVMVGVGIMAGLAFGLAYMVAEADGHARLQAWKDFCMADLHSEPFEGTRYSLEEATRWDRHALALLALSMAAVGLVPIGLLTISHARIEGDGGQS